jgi:hypothetical protein
MAQSLNVKITENDKTIVEVSLPARAIENLPDFLSPEVMIEIKKHSIDLEQLITQVLKEGLKPKVILDLAISERNYFVTLV